MLKGAALFIVWTGQPHRATRDLDFLGFGDATEARLRHVFGDVASMPTDDDGVVFDTRSIEVRPIREDQQHGGTRITLKAHVAEAQVRLQVDVGFGDAVTPEAVEVDFPVLLLFPAARLRVYPRETVVAEKLEAMVQLGMANSFMKDFYDLAVLSELFEFDGDLLVKAVRATFSRRGTPLPEGRAGGAEQRLRGRPRQGSTVGGLCQQVGRYRGGRSLVRGAPGRTVRHGTADASALGRSVARSVAQGRPLVP